METFVLNDEADYYFEIKNIIVNGKNAYELKGKFLDLHNNAFSGTNGKDAVKHVEYYQNIIDQSDYPIWREDGYCNGGNLPGAYQIGNSLHYQDLECDNESSNDCWKRWRSHEITYNDHDEIESENETHDERQKLYEAHELPVCNIRKFKMINYSSGQDEEYIAVKENVYDDLARTRSLDEVPPKSKNDMPLQDKELRST
nr:hypothetical protein [Tanacetum cinerariifolium]